MGPAHSPLAVSTEIYDPAVMRLVEDHAADALYVIVGEQRPHRMLLVDEGTVVDVDRDGRLLGLMVLAPQRDWTAQLEQVLAEHPLPRTDAARLRHAAAPR